MQISPPLPPPALDVTHTYMLQTQTYIRTYAYARDGPSPLPSSPPPRKRGAALAVTSQQACSLCAHSARACACRQRHALSHQ